MPKRREQTVVAQPLRCQAWRAGVGAACGSPSAIRASPGVSFRKATVHRAPRQLVSGSCQPRVKPRLTPGFSRPAVCSRTLRPQQRQDQTTAWPAQTGQDRQAVCAKSVVVQPSETEHAGIKAPGGSRGTPGANTTQRAMQIREEPNHPVSPDFRPGLPVKRAPGREHTRIGHAGLWPVSRSITPTSSFTAAMLLSSAARSSGSNLSSMIFSTPPLPSTTGTPTK